MNRIKKFRLATAKEDKMTKVHLMTLLDLYRDLCVTDRDRICFSMIFDHMEPGNIIPDFWSTRDSTRDESVSDRIPDSGLAIIKDMIDILWEADYIRPYDDDMDAFVLNPGLLSHGLTKRERRELRYKYNSLSKKENKENK